MSPLAGPIVAAVVGTAVAATISGAPVSVVGHPAGFGAVPVAELAADEGTGGVAPPGPGGAFVSRSPAPSGGPAYGTYDWPVRGPVVRGFDPPESTFGSGHRGIDIEVPFGTRVGASAAGVVAFAGSVAGSLFVSIDHPDGVRTTYSWLSDVAVRRGERVGRGQVIGATGSGHPGSGSSHLHFGARIGETYIDPMLLLGRGSIVGLVHLAPLDQPSEPREADP